MGAVPARACLRFEIRPLQKIALPQNGPLTMVGLSQNADHTVSSST